MPTTQNASNPELMILPSAHVPLPNPITLPTPENPLDTHVPISSSAAAPHVRLEQLTF
jgi:hypothetical protein